MNRLVTINIDKEYLKFSAGHFTIFSDTSRERLHGHNFAVRASVQFPVDDTGINFDYKEFKDAMRRVCDSLDEYTLIAAKSKYLKIENEGEFYKIWHHDKYMLLRQDETILLPVFNTTIEELSTYVLNDLLSDKSMIDDNNVRHVCVGVSSGPGQWAESTWSKNDEND